jgi:hypothetical protein
MKLNFRHSIRCNQYLVRGSVTENHKLKLIHGSSVKVFLAYDIDFNDKQLKILST